MSPHPLVPLSAAEIHQAVQLLKSSPEFTSTTRVISIALQEPEKSVVYRWPEVEAVGRSAIAVLFDNGRNRAYSARLDLTAQTAAKWRAAPEGAQPTMSIDEQIE